MLWVALLQFRQETMAPDHRFGKILTTFASALFMRAWLSVQRSPSPYLSTFFIAHCSFLVDL